jgi:hypothetical protein
MLLSDNRRYILSTRTLNLGQLKHQFKGVHYEILIFVFYVHNVFTWYGFNHVRSIGSGYHSKHINYMCVGFYRFGLVLCR